MQPNKPFLDLRTHGQSCTVARLMRQMGLRGAVRGKTVKTTISDRSTPCPADRVNRHFRARYTRVSNGLIGKTQSPLDRLTLEVVPPA